MKLFHAFSQVDASTKRRYDGTGLGLHLSQKLAELLGGHITLQSAYGTGSTFTLVLTDSSPMDVSKSFAISPEATRV